MLRTAALSIAVILALLAGGTSNAQSPPPDPPTLLSITEKENGDLQLEFTSNAAAHTHQVELLRAEAETGDYTSIVNLESNASPVDLGARDRGYWYRAQAKACDDQSRCSTAATSNSIHHAPSSPTGLMLEITNTLTRAMRLTWTPGNTGYGHRFTILTAEHEFDEFTEIVASPVAAAGDVMLDFTPAASGLYKMKARACRVTAGDGIGCSAESVESNIIQTGVPDPHIVAEATGSTQIKISWPRTGGIARYRLKQSVTQAGPYTEIATPSGDAFSHVHTGLGCGSENHYILLARGDGINYPDEWSAFYGTDHDTTDSCNLHTFSPEPLGLGGSSDEWTIPAGLTMLHVKATTSGGPGGDAGSDRIEVRHTPPGGTSPVATEIRTDIQGTNIFVTAESRVTITVPASAPDILANRVNLEFYGTTDRPGQDGPITDMYEIRRGPLLAKATILLRPDPGQPIPAVEPWTLGEDGTLTLSWAEGIQPAGVNPNRHQVSIPDRLNPGSFHEYEVRTGTTLDIPDALTALGAGTHTAAIRHCNAGGCGMALEISFTVTGDTLTAPTGIDVTPLPEREAMIGWTAPSGSASDTRYSVQWAESPDSPETDWEKLEIPGDTTGTKTTESTQLAIKLYPHLINHDSFAVRVTAGAGESSEAVIIVDSPITRADGNSRGITGTQGKATIKWPAIPGARNFQLEIREMEVTEADTKVIFKPEDALTYTADSGTTHSQALKKEKLHAVQLNYETDQGKVFSGMDAYVWVSDRAVDRTSENTFFVFKRGKEYGYHVCTDTFGQDHEKWAEMIEAAAETWEPATNRLAIITPMIHSTCEGREEIVREITERIEELLPPDGGEAPDTEEIKVEARRLAKNLQDTRTLDTLEAQEKKRNDIRGISRNRGINFLYDEGMSDITTAFLDSCFYEVFKKNKTATGCSTNPFKEVDNDLLLVFPGTGIPDPSNISGNEFQTKFNTCLPNIPGKYFRSDLFEIIIHEVGHALGITEHPPYKNPRRDPKGAPRPEDKPGLDTVMNYHKIDGAKTDNYGKSGKIGECSPSRMDIMAIYMMYQTDGTRRGE